MNYDLNLKSKPIKLLEKKIEENLYNLVSSKEFLDRIPKEKYIKEKKK